VHLVIDAVIEVKALAAFFQVTGKAVLDAVGMDVDKIVMGKAGECLQVAQAHGLVALVFQGGDNGMVVVHGILDGQGGGDQPSGCLARTKSNVRV